jgi:hypothetical protein
MINPAVKLKMKAYSVAIAVFAVMYFGANIYTHYRPLMTGQDLAILLWNLDMILSLIVPGYVAAQISKSQRVPMGMTVGLLAGVIATSYNFFSYGPHAALSQALGLILWSAGFGGIGGLLSGFRRLPSNSPGRKTSDS